MITFNICGIMLLPLFMVIVVQMKRMATQSHVFAYCYLTAAVSGATLFALATSSSLLRRSGPAAIRSLSMLLNDMAWIIFIAPVGALVAMNLLLAAAIHFDNGPNPVFPRWVGYYSLATGLAMAPAVGAAIFRTGPLAWDGPVSFWLRNGPFALFVLVMFFVLGPGSIARPSRKGSRSEQRGLDRPRRRTPNPSTPNSDPGGQADVWIVFWIVPAFYTVFGIIFFVLARVTPPPRPDVTTDQTVDFFTPTPRRSRSGSR